MSKCELIELQDLSVNDPIELAAPAVHIAPPTANLGHPSHYCVVRLVGDNVSIEASGHHTGESGVGHDFQPYSHAHLTWCDLCGEFMWGLYKQSLRCTSKYFHKRFVYMIILVIISISLTVNSSHETNKTNK